MCPSASEAISHVKLIERDIDLKEGTHGQLLEEMERLKATINENQEILATSKDHENEMIAKCKDLEMKIKNGPAEREKELKKAEKSMKVKR